MPISLQNILNQAQSVNNEDSHIIIKNDQVQSRGSNALSRFFYNHFKGERNINTANTFKELLRKEYGQEFANLMERNFFANAQSGTGIKARSIRNIQAQIEYRNSQLKQTSETPSKTLVKEPSQPIPQETLKKGIIELRDLLSSIPTDSATFFDILNEGLESLYQNTKQEEGMFGKLQFYQQALNAVLNGDTSKPSDSDSLLSGTLRNHIQLIHLELDRGSKSESTSHSSQSPTLQTTIPQGTTPSQVKAPINLSAEEQAEITKAFTTFINEQRPFVETADETTLDSILINVRTNLMDFAEKQVTKLGNDKFIDVFDLLSEHLLKTEKAGDLKDGLLAKIQLEVRNKTIAELKESLKTEPTHTTIINAITNNSMRFDVDDLREILGEAITYTSSILTESGKNLTQVNEFLNKTRQSLQGLSNDMKQSLLQKFEFVSSAAQRSAITTELIGKISASTSAIDFTKMLSSLSSLSDKNAPIALTALLEHQFSIMGKAKMSSADIYAHFSNISAQMKKERLAHGSALNNTMANFQAKIRSQLLIPNKINGAEISEIPSGGTLPGKKVEIKPIAADRMQQATNTCFIVSTLRGLVEKASGRAYLSELIHKDDKDIYHVALTFKDKKFDVAIDPNKLGHHKLSHGNRPVEIDVFEAAIAKFMESFGIDGYKYTEMGVAQDVGSLLGLTPYEKLSVTKNGHTIESFKQTYSEIANDENTITMYRTPGHWRTLLSLSGENITIGNSGSQSVQHTTLANLADSIINVGGAHIVTSFTIPPVTKPEEV